MPEPTKKVAPPRNELPKVELSRNSRASELQGRDPAYHYEYFAADPSDSDHPSYIGSKLRDHEIGDEQVGYAVVKAWEVCSAKGPTVPVDPRTDQGKPVDTTIRKGRSVLCRIPKAEHAKYQAVENARIEARSKGLFGKPDRVAGVGTTVTALNSHDMTADPAALLKAAGHPMNA